LNSLTRLWQAETIVWTCDGPLLIVLPFPSYTRLTTRHIAINRNEFVAALSLEDIVPHALSQGKTEALDHVGLKSGASLLNRHDENADLIDNGTSKYAMNRVKKRQSLRPRPNLYSMIRVYSGSGNHGREPTWPMYNLS
jgi:hypothetical protein